MARSCRSLLLTTHSTIVISIEKKMTATIPLRVPDHVIGHHCHKDNMNENQSQNNNCYHVSPVHRGRKNVQFPTGNQLETTQIIANVDDLTRHERQSLWYTRQEMIRLRKVCDALATDYLAFYSDEELLERFGIQSASYRRQRHGRVQCAVRCIIQQQQVGYFFGGDDSDVSDVDGDDKADDGDDDGEDQIDSDSVHAAATLYSNISKLSSDSAVLRAMRIEKQLYRQ
jgi:hypothetical protein